MDVGKECGKLGIFGAVAYAMWWITNKAKGTMWNLLFFKGENK